MELEKDLTYEETIEWWKKASSTYFTSFYFGFSDINTIKDLYLTKDSVILEIGFGFGRETRDFLRISEHVFGVDLSENHVALASKALKEEGVKKLPTLKVYDGIHIPFEDNTFDLIYSCFVIQHMSKQSGIELLANALCKLKPAGVLLFEFFGDPEYTGGKEKNSYMAEPDKGHIFNNAYSPEDITWLISQVNTKTPCRIAWKKPWIWNSEEGFHPNYWVALQKC